MAPPATSARESSGSTTLGAEELYGYPRVTLGDNTWFDVAPPWDTGDGDADSADEERAMATTFDASNWERLVRETGRWWYANVDVVGRMTGGPARGPEAAFLEVSVDRQEWRVVVGLERLTGEHSSGDLLRVRGTVVAKVEGRDRRGRATSAIQVNGVVSPEN